MKIISVSTLSSKEQLTLPQAVRRLLGVKAGDSLAWGLDDEGRVMVEAGRPHSLADVRAAIAAARPRAPRVAPATIADMKAGIVAAIKRKHASR
jgi:bifunctional DNA-binding transcriptional regulator/antitoxin component of YhaV-PrlF toxin-antitoxin module